MHASSSANYPLIILSILTTAIFWGVYGPFLQWGHAAMESGRMRPFICVGIAYLLVAVIGPVVVISVFGMERGAGIFSGWTASGILWSLLAGVAGAIGALGMLLAFNFGGKPHYVPPLIFGFAPVVNTAFVLWVNPALRAQMSASPIQSSAFGAGLLMVAVGAVTVLVAAPKPKPAAAKPAAAAPAAASDAATAPSAAPAADAATTETKS